MEIGTGIAIMGGVFGIVAIIYRLFPDKKNGDQKNDPRHCADHSGICVAIDNFTDWLKKIEDKLDKVIMSKP